MRRLLIAAVGTCVHRKNWAEGRGKIRMGTNMKKIFLAAVAGVALLAAGVGNSADAADVYRKAPAVAPAPPAPPPFSWTGCFIGAHWGWGWGRKDIDEKFVETEDGIVLSSFGVSGRIDT